MKKRRIIRILLIILSMVCGSMSASAQIKNGDIVSISYNDGDTYYYMALDEYGYYGIKSTTSHSIECLWKVIEAGQNQYAFQSIANPTKHISGNYTFTTAETGTAFTYDNEKRLTFVRYGGYTFYAYIVNNLWAGATATQNALSLTIEKWELAGGAGGEVTGKFEPGSLVFGCNQTGNNEVKNLKFTLKPGGGAGGYYYCLNRDDVQITVPAAANNIKEKRKAIELADISFKWRKNGNSAISKANCSTLADSEVKERDMLELSWEKSTTEEDTWNITITAKGASPTNLVDANGDWIDYTDEVVATFRSKDSETTNRVSAEVKREAYHLQEWPTFDVGVSPTSYTFGKRGEETSFTLICIHQNGANIIKSDGVTEAGTIERVARVDVTNASTITFFAKSMLDETNVDWLTVESVNNGVVTVSASDNSQNTTEREARLVGVITYTDPNDANDTHTKTVVIPIKQRVKDGTMTFLPQKGYANTEFGKNPYTGRDEQMVHTAEKTIYYKPGENIKLRIAETSFNGYYRWYDYQTGGNPQFNAVESDRTTWTTQPTGTLINNSNGDTHGIYSTNSEGGTIPIIKGWTDGKAHIIACDISNYHDYTLIGEGTQLDTIIEPTLSFRQLFHLRPAQEMAERFKAAAAKQEFVENHKYTAPVGQTIYLTTDYRYAGGDESDRSYYYYANGVDAADGYKCVGKNDITAKWFEVNGETYTNITPQSYTAKDYLSRNITTTGTKVYELGVDVNNNNKIDDGDVRIARFVVDFVSDCGPSKTALITRNQILDNYVLLEEIDFSFSSPAPGNTIKFLDHHLNWEDASYGYVYPEVDGVPVRTRSSGGSNYNPYWGEYYLVNKIPEGCNWAWKTENQGGMANGYALYVDGTSEPGLVASISTKATVCSGQTMYCSMWLSNVSNDVQNGVDPVFRCNIQGRNAGDTEWTDVGVFFVGAMTNKDGNWYQINFPVLSDKESYDETRVCIYNFAISAGGNDFMIDDIRLYVSPLSLAAYMATMGCRSATNVEEASTAVVVRMDYTQLNPDMENKWVYYQLHNTTDDRVVELKTLDGEGNIISAYYAENQDKVSEAFGSVQIPGRGYIPAEWERVPQLEAHLHTLVDNGTRHSKCYVRDASNTKWYLYVIHVIPNTQQDVVGDDADIYLEKDKDYRLVIANDPKELAEPLCSSTTPIHPTTDTYVELRDTEGSIERVECKDELCANNIYFLNVRVENTFASGIGGGLETMGAQVHADWLIGEATDDAYCHARTMTKEERQAADDDFQEKYGCSRHQLREAISHMRQMPSADYSNPNYKQADVNQLVTTDFFQAKELALIQRLCAEGKLSLYKKHVQFYMGSEEIVRYWAYPVAQDTSIVFNGSTYPLFDCDEPLWVKVQSSYSDYAVNLSPLDKDDQTHKQRLEIPSVRILEGTTEVAIPIKELLDSTLLSTNLDFAPGRDTLKFSYHTPIPRVLEYVSITDAAIRVVEAPATLEVGEDYLMRMAFYDQDGNAYIQGDTTDCRVGYVYFYLSVVPKTVQWTGAVSNIWGDDGNWKGVRADGSLTDKGFAPMAETNVILPNGAAPIIQEEDLHPMDVNYSPHACDNIYFKVGSMVYNQHLLEYKKAFVDMQIGAANWNSMAPPLKGMYTGDMYVPHEGQVSVEFDDVTDHSNYPFAVSGFKGTRTSKAPYVFWQSLYNKRVTIYHENGNQSYPALTESANFLQTNSLGQVLPVGSGYQVLGFGPTRGGEDEIIVRLPKPDTYYSYYNKDGTESSQRVSVSHSNRLAFEPNQSGNMTITLTSDIASNQFMFGNPTMANIDMQKFLADNTHISAYYKMQNSTWQAETPLTAGVLEPMRSVLLKLKDGLENRTSITITVSANHMSTPVQQAARVPSKKAPAQEAEEAQSMTIFASCDNGQARCALVAHPYAQDIYDGNEDALFLSSGVEDGVNSATATSPINMYTVAQQVPMMVDVRANIDTVPVSMLVHNSYRTEKVKFAFYLSLNWNKECYFWDSETDKKFRILDGLWLEMDMPQNHVPRYFIIGPDMRSDNDDNVTTSTTNPSKPEMGAEINIWAYSPEQGKMVVTSNDIIKAVNIYDPSGRLIAQKTLDLQYNSTSVSVPAGVYVVEATMRDNGKQYTQAVVW